MEIISKEQINKRLQELASEINNKYNEVTLLVVLTGGVYTAIDLSKYITIPCKLEFVKISSYGNEQEAGNIDLKWISSLDLDNVIIVDDICDTGCTLNYLENYLRENNIKNIAKLVLLDKPSRRKELVKLDYIGFVIDNVFVYGYGLDNKEYDRNILAIHKV